MKRWMAGLLEATPETGAGGGRDIRSAFRSAIASATAGKDITVEDTPSSGDDDDEDDDAEGDDPDDTDDDSAEEDSDDADESKDGAKKDDTDDDEDDAEGDAEDDDEEGDKGDKGDKGEKPVKAGKDGELLSDKELKAIQRKYPNDPAAQIKAYQSAFTKKTQDLAGERKSYKAMLSYMPLIQAYENDAESTIQRLAKLHGLKLVSDETADAPLRGKGKKAAAADEDDGKELIDGILADFKKDLGPELEYLADGLAPAMSKALQKIAEHTVGKRVKSLEDATASVVRGNAEIESDRVMESFYKAHTDWEDYQEEMNALAVTLIGEGDNIRPVPMSESQFLEFLYETVKSKHAASTSKESIEKEARRLMKKRLAKLSTARSGDRRATATVTDDKIHRRPKGSVSIRDAFKAAKAGTRFEDDDDDDE